MKGRGDPYLAYQQLGAEAKEAILELLPDEWSFEGRRVLDFGCGAGRTLRHFLDEARLRRALGGRHRRRERAVAPALALSPLHAELSPEAPPLRFDSGSFDLIWALSVFTHLTEHSAAWMLELHRLLKPGGLLLATYMGKWTSRDHVDEPWEEDRIGMNVLRARSGLGVSAVRWS